VGSDSTLRATATDVDEIWLQSFDPRPLASLRVVCFPHAGGSASFFRTWARALPQRIETLAVQYPGRMNRLSEALIDDAGEMADAMARVLVCGVATPFALFGHSMGAAIAFETALRLEGRFGVTPLRLVVSAKAGPSLHRPGRRHLAGDEALFAELRRLGGTDAAVFDEPHLLPLILPILRNDVKLSETWTPSSQARVGCPVTAFAGDADPEVAISEARAWEHVSSEFDLRVFPGHHFYLVERRQEVLRELARRCSVDNGDHDHLEWAYQSSST
jgi:pyochelin biosynthetic protein PchC